MKLVVIESPLGAESRELIEDNKRYARTCMRDSLRRGEAPFASHLLYDHPDILDDMKPQDRELGIRAGFAWGVAAEIVAFYVDRGISRGMVRGFERALLTDADIVVRSVVSRMEMIVPIMPELSGTLIGQEARKRNLDNLTRMAAVVITERDGSSVSYAPEPTPRTLPGLSDS